MQNFPRAGPIGLLEIAKTLIKNKAFFLIGHLAIPRPNSMGWLRGESLAQSMLITASHVLRLDCKFGTGALHMCGEVLQGFSGGGERAHWEQMG